MGRCRNFATLHTAKEEAKQERANWDDFQNQLEAMMGPGQPDVVKKEEEDDDGDIDLSNVLAAATITEIGTQRPVEDFRALLKKRDKPQLFEDLCKQMWEVVHRIISGSYRDTDHPKALECVTFMRDQSILEESPLVFNRQMRKFKDKYEARKKSLWQDAVKQGLTLLSVSDLAGVWLILCSKVMADLTFWKVSSMKQV